MITERDKKLANIAAAWSEAPDSDVRWLLEEVERLEKAFETQKFAMQALETRDRSTLGVINDKQARIKALESAIRNHRAQKADDRCIEDDDALYAALGDGIPCDRAVGDKFQMLANCARFINQRCNGGTWPSYAELEARIACLESQNAQIK